jgi:hypothetical protein
MISHAALHFVNVAYRVPQGHLLRTRHDIIVVRGRLLPHWTRGLSLRKWLGHKYDSLLSTMVELSRYLPFFRRSTSWSTDVTSTS